MPKIRKKARFLEDIFFRLALRILIKSYKAYQPVEFDGGKLWPGQRDFEHRWALIRREVEECGAKTLLDVGCAEGYFVQRAARDLGCFALGIEGDVRRLTVAQNINTLECNERTGFMYDHIDLASMARLPKFDVILFLSVLHHFMRLHGVDYSRKALDIIRTKTNKVMIFDMGMRSELLDWAKGLPGAVEEPSARVVEFLQSAGFSRVEEIGDTAAGRRGLPRPMFRAFP